MTQPLSVGSKKLDLDESRRFAPREKDIKELLFSSSDGSKAANTMERLCLFYDFSRTWKWSKNFTTLFFFSVTTFAGDELSGTLSSTLLFSESPAATSALFSLMISTELSSSRAEEDLAIKYN